MNAAEHPLATRRALEFLRESDAIEGIGGLDYENPERRAPGRGHWGAYADMVFRAETGSPIGANTLALWQGLICEEQRRHGHPLPEPQVGRLRGPWNPVDVRVGGYIPPGHAAVPGLVAGWVAETNRRADHMVFADSEVVEAIADALQTFEAIHPFADGNGRVGRLAANWMARRLGAALIVFRAAERPAYYSAHRSKRAMRAFIAGKIREAVANESEDVPVLSSTETADRYRMTDGRELIVERHELLEALERWAEEDRARGRG
jgi:Fic family protein